MDYTRACSILGVNQYATVIEANDKYRKLSLIRHPDRRATGSHALMQELNEAISIFRERRQYHGESDQQSQRNESHGPSPKPAKRPENHPTPPQPAKRQENRPTPPPQPARCQEPHFQPPKPAKHPEFVNVGNHAQPAEKAYHSSPNPFAAFQQTPRQPSTETHGSEKSWQRHERETQPLSDQYRLRLEQRLRRRPPFGLITSRLCSDIDHTFGATISFDSFLKDPDRPSIWLSSLLINQLEPCIDNLINSYYRHKCERPIKIEPWQKCTNTGVEADLEWNGGLLLDWCRNFGDGNMSGDPRWIIRTLGELLNTIKWVRVLNAHNCREEKICRDWKMYDGFDVLMACGIRACHMRYSNVGGSAQFDEMRVYDHCMPLVEILQQGWVKADQQWRSKLRLLAEPYA